MKFFAIFLEFSITGRVRTHRNDFFLFFLFLGLPQHILARKEAIIVFSNFLNCFTIFLEFPIMGWVRTRRNDFFIFYFLSFLAFPNLYWLEKLPKWWFLIFWIVLLFFGIFYYGSSRNSSERFFFLLSLFLSISQLIFPWKEGIMVFF